LRFLIDARYKIAGTNRALSALPLTASMRLAIKKKSQVSVQMQIIHQTVLGILSGDIKPGEKLASRNKVHTRNHIHPNTVSAAYAVLRRRGLVEYKRGDGYYVRKFGFELDPSQVSGMDQMVMWLIKNAMNQGITFNEVRRHMQRWCALPPPDHFLVVEPEVELREILLAEIKQATKFKVRGTGPDELLTAGIPPGAVVVALFSQERMFAQAVSPNNFCLSLYSPSILKYQQKLSPREPTVSVVSGWRGFLDRAKVIIDASEVNYREMTFSHPCERGWEKSLKGNLVFTDLLTSKQIPPRHNAHIIPIIAESSLARLRMCIR
jgi:DNA-binding transcriptional regulator YhcF (GntR family)